MSAFNCFREAFFCCVFSSNLYLFTISLAKENALTVEYSLTMFSKHKDWHSFDTSMSHCSTMLFHKLFASGDACTSSITLSIGNEVCLPVLECLLKHDSAISAIFTSQLLGAHNAPLEIDEMYWFSSVGTFIESNNA